MRVIAAILFSAFILIGMGAYVRFADNITPIPINFDEEPATGEYTIDVTLTFDVENDPFAGIEETGLRISLAGTTLLDLNKPVRAGTPIRLNNVEGVKVGKNEFLVFASPGVASVIRAPLAADLFSGFDTDPANTDPADGGSIAPSIGVSRALRVRVFEGENPDPISEKTIWSDRGPVQGTVEVFVGDESLVADHEH